MKIGASFGENLVPSPKPFAWRSKNQIQPFLGRETSEGGDAGPFLEILLTFLVISIFFLFVGRLFNLQVFEGNYNLRLATSNQILKLPIKAERGLILGKSGKVLAGNAPSFDLYFKPRDCPKMGCENDFLKSFKFYTPEVEALFRSSFEKGAEVTVLRDLSQDEAIKLIEVSQKANFLEVRSGQKRDYKYPMEYFHLLGYLTAVSENDIKKSDFLSPTDKIGRLGLEKQYDSVLKGIDGGEIFEGDASGKIIRKIREVPAIPGDNLILNIDEALQENAYKNLEEGMKNSQAKAGVVVIEEVGSGRLLALVSLPALNANVFSSPLTSDDFRKLEVDERQPFFNRAVSGLYPPGSVFKLVVAAGVLGEKIVNPQTLIEGPGAISLGAFTYRDWKPEGHGAISLTTAIAESCDTCFYTIGGGYGNQKGLGEAGIAKYARLFGFGETLGLDLSGEEGGLVPDGLWKRKVKGLPWYIGDTYHYAIGQGFLLVTPLQINSLTSVVANGGTLYRPFLANEVKDGKGSTLLKFEPKILRQKLVSEDILSQIRLGMEKATQPGGTAYPFFDFKIKVGGKTGTAETGHSTTHAWFTAYVPAQDPQIALTVFLEEGGEGSRDAAPIARKILEEYSESTPKGSSFTRMILSE